MCQEVFQIVQSMDIKSVELQLALQCAPLITGIKISNLLIVDRASESAVRVILRYTGISHFRLLQTEEKTTFLLFRRSQLEQYLAGHDICDILYNEGYNEFSLGAVLRTFQMRYMTYMNQRGQFPHEMGLLLGYPVEDVKGFIDENGQNFLYSGYWKVYDNVPAKKRLFKKYEDAKESLIQLLASDIDMRLIIEMYKEEPCIKAAV